MVSIKRFGLGLAMAALLVAMSAGAALGGEVTGTGEPTPIKNWVAKSICAFSGLNDREVGEGPVEPRVQSFGQVVRSVGPIGGVPGHECNPTRAQH